MRVTPLRATTLIDAPEGAVRRVLSRTDIWTRTAHAMGARAEVKGIGTGPRAALRDGDLIRVRPEPSRRFPAGPDFSSLVGRRSLIFRIGVAEPHAGGVPDSEPASSGRRVTLPSLTLVAGPLRRCDIRITTASTAAGTLVTIDSRVLAATTWRTPLLRRPVLKAAQMFLGIATLAAREVQIVVAGAIIRDQHVLAARRTGPPELAGFWELPGGKVDPGETEPEALIRELAEELGISVYVNGRVGPDVDLGDNMVLRCYRTGVANGELSPVEHDEVRWIAADELDTVPWVQADATVVQILRAELQG